MAKNKAKAPQNGNADDSLMASNGTDSPDKGQAGSPSTDSPSSGEADESSTPSVARTRKRDLAEPSEKFNLVTFFQGTKEELSKVVWPTRQQLISESAAVLLMVSLSATFVYLIDNIFTWAARQVFG